MKKNRIYGNNGYDIPCISNVDGAEKQIILFSHGFGSSKESPTVLAVSAALERLGIGSCGFDFPAHGESPADGEMLRIGNCIRDLSAVEHHLRGLAPDAEIAYFSSSFGAYINLLYLAEEEHYKSRSFLRCAAVDMPGIIQRSITADDRVLLEQQGYLIADMDYVRPLKITAGFLEDLEQYDVFDRCHTGMAELAMIHGTADETASLDDARRFAEQFSAVLTEVEGADHRFLIPGGSQRVIDTAMDFFTVRR